MLSYSLTDFTGSRKNEGREMVVMTFEVRRHTLVVSALSLLGSLIIALPFFLIFGTWALLIPAIGVLVGNVMFASRQRRGLQVYRYKTLLDSRKSARGFWISGSPFATPEFILHMPSVVPVAAIDELHASRREVGDNTPVFARGVKDTAYAGEHRVGIRERRG